MSSTEFHRGKAKKVEFDGELSLEQKVSELKYRGFEFNYDDVDGDEYIDIDCDKLVYMFESGDFYELLEHHESRDEEQHLAIADKNDDGTIMYPNLKGLRVVSLVSDTLDVSKKVKCRSAIPEKKKFKGHRIQASKWRSNGNSSYYHRYTTYSQKILGHYKIPR